MKNKYGQASLFLIILSAIAIIFFAISMNWGRVSQYKNLTMVAATTSAAQLTSSYASYGQMFLKEQLGGELKVCKHNSIFGAILTLIIVIIIVIMCYGTCTGILAGAGGISAGTAIAAVALSAASLALQIAVVQPGLTKYWNRLQEDAGLSEKERFLTSGLQVALQNATTDQALVTDYFDENFNGKTGVDPLTLTPHDAVSRFGFYYSEYLRSLKPTRPNLNSFIIGLRGFASEVLTIPADDDPLRTNKEDPRFNPCCVPLLDNDGNRLRPTEPTCYDDSTIPAECNGDIWSGAPYHYGDVYPLSYEPTRPDYSRDDSFLTKLGIDFEVRPFNADPRNPNIPNLPFVLDDPRRRGEPTHLFKAFIAMDKIRKLPTDPANALPNNKITDVVDKIPNYRAADNVCTNELQPTDGINWKPGKDTYCQGIWPYGDCRKYEACGNSDTGANCCNSGDAAQGLWPEDSLDNTIDDLKEFYFWAAGMLNTPISELTGAIDSAYDNNMVYGKSGRYWLGPPCDGTNQNVCSDQGYNNAGGVLYTIKERVASWVTPLRSWAYDANRFADDNAWCVPASDAGLSQKEKDIITASGTVNYGSSLSVINCLAWYAAPQSVTHDQSAVDYFKACDNKIESIKAEANASIKFANCKTAFDAKYPDALKAEGFAGCKAAVTTLSNDETAYQGEAGKYAACSAKIVALLASPTFCTSPGNTTPTAECAVSTFNTTNNPKLVPQGTRPSYLPCTSTAFKAFIDNNQTYFTNQATAICALPKPSPACTTDLPPAGNEPAYNVCNAQTTTTYKSWLTAQQATYGTAWSAICADPNQYPLPACVGLPSSRVTPVPNPCANPYNDNTAAYSYWLYQSQLQANSGQTWIDYCNLPISQQIPIQCSTALTLPRSMHGAPPSYDVCPDPTQIGAFQQWVKESINDATNGLEANRQKFKDRFDDLSPTVTEIKDQVANLEGFAVDLQNFLSGPVANLLTALNSVNVSQVDTVPNSIIYGWKDENPPKGKNREGYWHVVRVSAVVPAKVPWIKTWTRGFLGSTRCYELKDYSGNIRVNITRWDEDHDVAKFANNFPIWKVSFRKPGKADVVNPGQICIGSNGAWKQIGISKDPDTWDILSQVLNVETNGATRKQLSGAFMIAGAPKQEAQECYDYVTKSLMPSGVTSSVCMRYDNDPKIKGIGMHFVPCQ